MGEPDAKSQLQERTRLRNRSVWVPMDWGGLLDPLQDQQADLDLLAAAGVENNLAVTDAEFDIKESQRDRATELSQQEIDQEAQIAENKAATGRAKLAIQKSADEYMLAARVYDAKVKGIIMEAREYAALVEREQLQVQESQVGLEIDKEGLHLKQINAQIYYETIQQAQVDADLARAQVDAAKAHVRAVMADIEAGRADIEVLEAEVLQYMAEADKATLQADVAQIFAEILTHQLSAIRLDIGQREIAAGFGYVQSRLSDMLVQWEHRTAVETILTSAEADFQAEVALNLAANEQEQDLRVTEVDNSLQTLSFETGQTAAELAQERAIQQALTNIRTNLLKAQSQAKISQDNQDTWGQELVYAAQQAAAAHRTVQRYLNTSDFTTKTIS